MSLKVSYSKPGLAAARKSTYINGLRRESCQLKSALVSLDISSSRLTDDDLVPLSKLTKIRSLGAGFNLITDRTLMVLAECRNLTELDLSNTLISGSGLKNLGNCKALWSLSLSNCPVRDNAISNLLSFNKLEHLSLSGTKVTDAALDIVSLLPDLRKLYLCDTIVCGTGLVRFKGHRKLEWIHLNRSQLVGRHLHYFTSMPALEGVSIGETGCGNRDIQELRRLLPGHVVIDF